MSVREKKLTVKQAIDALGLGRTTIYSWIKEGRLRSESTPRGKIILLTEEEEQKIREFTRLYSGEYDSEQFSDGSEDSADADFIHEGSVVRSESIQYGSSDFGTVRNQQDEVMLEMLRTLNNLNEKLLDYSEQAGQLKLLTDSEHRTKEEYFKLIQENASLKARLDRLEEENKTLRAQQEKKKGWFSLGR